MISLLVLLVLLFASAGVDCAGSTSSSLFIPSDCHTQPCSTLLPKTFTVNSSLIIKLQTGHKYAGKYPIKGRNRLVHWIRKNNFIYSLVLWGVTSC